MLDAIPCQEEWFIKVILDVDDNVVVGGGIDIGSWKLTIDENALLGDPQWRDGAIGDFPCEEKVRIFTSDHRHYSNGEA
jgi:hypothetical protein